MKILKFLAAALLTLAAASAQTFTATVDTPQGAAAITSGGTLTLSTDALGRAATSRLVLTYNGRATVTVTSLAIAGAPEFSVISPTLPVTLSPNQSVEFPIRFQATSGTRVTSRLTVNYTELAAGGSFLLNLQGQAPDLLFSYAQTGGNAIPISSGALIVFPQTRIGSSSTLTVSVTNRGSANGTIASITASTPAVTITGLPLPPFTVSTTAPFQFQLVFTPTARESSSGTLRIDLSNQVLNFNVQGAGAGPNFIYETVSGSTVANITANQTLQVADTQVGQSTTVGFRVRNLGNLDGQIPSVAILGTGYALTELPFFPVTLDVGSVVSFSVTFTPTQPGRATGRLRIGSDNFDLVSNGLGPLLNYRYTLADTVTPVQNNGTIVFSPIQVGSTQTATFEIRNDGTTATSVNSISVAPATPFTLSGLPPLPLTLAPGASAAISITFTPSVLTAAASVLRVGNQSFNLSGTGTAPPPLPAIQIDGPSGVTQPLQQPAFTLQLAQPYPLPLTGTLNITFNPEVFINDPTIQFSTGGRSVPFTIPANTQVAIFPNNALQIRLQTGSTAGSIVLTPTISTEGGINLTPATPPTRSLTIAQAAPQIVSAQLGSKTPNQFTILVSGLATGRTISAINLVATAQAGENLSNSSVSINAGPAFITWYGSQASQAFGSLFTASVVINLEGRANSATSLVDAIGSVAVTITNPQGTSPSASVALR